MKPLSSHLVLTAADTCEKACHQVEEFFDSTLLVRYDRIEILHEHCCSGESDEFSHRLQKSLYANRRVLGRFIDDFRDTGFKSIDDMQNVEHGYPSKLLHIITHFLDGFIGIDTRFYNMIDDSHWVPSATHELISQNPAHYWLIRLDGYSETPETASLIQQ